MKKCFHVCLLLFRNSSYARDVRRCSILITSGRAKLSPHKSLNMVRREYLFLQLVCLDLRITGFITCSSKGSHLLRVLSRKSVSKSSHPATRPMQTPRKARQKTKRSAPMTTEPVRLLHLKQHEFTTGILPRLVLTLRIGAFLSLWLAC